MKSWFCSEAGLSPAVKILAFDAGYVLTKNDPDKAKAILSVAQGIMATVDKGGTNDAMNSVFQQAVAQLLAEVKDPLIEANIMFVLNEVKFDPKLPEPPKLDNAVIKGLVDSFVQGMSLVKV